MNPAMHLFFGWLLRASAQAAVITILILLLQICLRKRLDARWRHLLWLLVLVRLAMPISLPSPTSLFNFVSLEPANTPVTPERNKPSAAMPAMASPESEPLTTQPALTSVPASPARTLQPNRLPAAPWTKPGWPGILAVIWGLGVAVLGLRTAIQNIAFSRRLRQGRVADDPEILTVLNGCKSIMGVRTTVVVVETEAVRSPALYGLFRLRLLIPPSMIDSFSTAELRHVLLHELAHVRRRDMLAQWLVTLFQTLHWFNPVLWFGFRRMVVDRELACDALALSAVGEREARAYGQTIVKLLEGCSRPPALPALVGILEDKAQMFQRVAMIARFKPRSRWSLAGIIAAIVLVLATLTGAQTKFAAEKAGAVLAGTVELTNGQPADATVVIYSATPRAGTSPFCPVCYPDCRKSAKTDNQGRFKIESLDPQLLFRLLVVGKDCQPAFVAEVDPQKEPVRVTLQRQDVAHTPPDQVVRGRIVDGKGAPIRFASITDRMVLFRDGTSGRSDQDIDPLAVSNERGEFVLTARRPLASLTLVVEAAGHARRIFPGVIAGKADDFRLTEGAKVKGRVMLKGEPLPNVSVGIISEDRSIDSYAGTFEVGTDTNGVFLFVNLPPNTRYQLCGLAKSFHAQGATKTITLTAGDDGTVTEAGDLAVEPAYVISGRVVLADGEPVPPKIQLTVGKRGWDSRSIDVAPDGSFSVDGVPPGAVCLALRIPGYRLSVKNESLDSLNPFWLLGRVNQDISGLVILMEKGKRAESYSDSTGNRMLPENRPLAGAEHYDSHARERMISGRVTDKETGRPVEIFTVTPGRPTGSRGINWNPQRVVTCTNGAYAIYVPKEQGAAALMIQAAGYLPQASPGLTTSQTNFDFAISKGSGPSGWVLLPDGKPAAGASVALMRPREQSTEVQLSARGKFRAFRHEELVVSADSNGRFAIQPALGMNAVVACAQDGFKLVSLDSLATNQQITLEPWGKVKGTIRRGGHPSAGEKLHLSFSGSFKDENLDMFTAAVTDDKGNFEFDFAPPADCQIYADTPTEGMPGRLSTEKEFQVEPGQTTNLTIEAAEKPVVDLARARQLMSRYSEVPTRTLQGVVLLPNGKPAAETQVGIADEQHQLQIGDGELVTGPLNPNVARTDQNGAFTVPWPSAGTRFFAANEEGVASLNIGGVTNGIRVALQPWARVEGSLRLNHAPAGGARVRLHQIDYTPGFAGFFQVDTTADSDGHFVIAHALPGTCGIGRWVEMGNGARSASDTMQFDLAPGESTNIVCGGDGRPVKGTLDLTLGKDVPADAYFSVTIHKTFPIPPGMSDAKQAWTSAEILKWRRSPAGKLAQAAYHAYVGPVSSNGTFQVDDVPPGNYEISINGHASGRASFGTMIEGISAVTNLIVPPLANTDVGEPYNLGHIPVTTTVRTFASHNAATNELKAGDLAPAIVTRTHDGKPLRLSDYRGKFVLLDLRLMLPGREMDGLQSVNDAFAKDDRLVTISLSQHTDDEFVKQITDKSLNHWMVGDLDFSALSAPYGLDGSVLPFIALVGPDGKIMASRLTGDSIYATVAQALGKK